MALTLKESQACADLAGHLYDYLPWSGDPSWKGHVSYRTVAEKVGLGGFWQPGSKHPMLTSLLQRTLSERRSDFERLVLEVVRAGITHRQKKGNPLTPENIDTLNGLILGVGFKFPDLWDPDFQSSLRMDGQARAKERVDQAVTEERLKETARSRRSTQLATLKDRFFALCGEPDRQKAGLALEKVLNELFALEGLAPREPFRVVGEQIDGSFDLDHETYLTEAKWEKNPLPEAPLLVLRGKIEGKSAYTRGVFIALNGISAEARLAITHGKQPTFFIVDGHDLTMVLSEEVALPDLFRQRRRILAEEGHVYVPYSELWSGSRSR